MLSCIKIHPLFLFVFLSLWFGCVDGHVKAPLRWDAVSSVTAPDPQGPRWMDKRYALSLIVLSGMYRKYKGLGWQAVWKESIDIQQIVWLFSLRFQALNSNSKVSSLWYHVIYTAYFHPLLYFVLVPFTVSPPPSFFSLHLNNTFIQPMRALLMCPCMKMKLWHSVKARKRCWNEILLHRNAKVTTRNVVMHIYIQWGRI